VGGTLRTGDRAGIEKTNMPSFRSYVLFWLKMGCVSFGGPAAHIALMHREVVERKGWVSEERFSRALGFCMLLPGPEAQQLATYIGWRMFGVRGGVIAGALFVLPSALLLWLLCLVYVSGGHLPVVAGFFEGLQPVVVALIMNAAVRIGRTALRSPFAAGVAAASFLLLALWQTPSPLVLLGALATGFVFPSFFARAVERFGGDDPGGGRSVAAGCVALAVWLVPVSLLVVFERGILSQLAVFFSTTSLVTFGGAYAILPYVAEASVAYGWLAPREMLDGLGLAEATPGPLIIVLQFVGFLAGYHHPQGLPALLAATAGSVVATWTTFVPSFAWIFLGAPHVERVLGNRRLSAGLGAVSASVVGIVLSLALWFGLQVFFPTGRADWFPVVLCVGALFLNRIGVVPLILLGGFAGVFRQAVFGWSIF